MSTKHGIAARTGTVLLALVAMLTILFGAAGLLAAAERLGTYTTDKQRFHLVRVTDGLEHPWGLAFLPDGRMLVTERPGRLRIVADGWLVPEPVAGVPEVWDEGQGGLLDVALHPGFAENGLVYLSYS
ncbi:MAG: PQQ-dependent sugar dehydrogenase, partial [Rhodospirillaceae bacterium]|nr:PQQ-dependent sugar dehydrogenase [Rhodospirillaceae bacterium]